MCSLLNHKSPYQIFLYIWSQSRNSLTFSFNRSAKRFRSSKLNSSPILLSVKSSSCSINSSSNFKYSLFFFFAKFKNFLLKACVERGLSHFFIIKFHFPKKKKSRFFSHLLSSYAVAICTKKKKISIQTSGLILKNKSNVCLTVFLPTSPLTILLLKSNMVSCCCSGIFNEKLVNYLKKDQSFSTDTLQSLEIILSIFFVPTFGDTLLNHRALYLW